MSRHHLANADGIGGGAVRESQKLTASEDNVCDWVSITMDQVVCNANIHHACERVVRNKGACVRSKMTMSVHGYGRLVRKRFLHTTNTKKRRRGRFPSLLQSPLKSRTSLGWPLVVR